MADGNQQTFTNFINAQPENVRMDILYNIIFAMDDGYGQEEFEIQTNETKYQRIYITSDAYGKDTKEQEEERLDNAEELINDINTSIEYIMNEINQMLPDFNAPLATEDDIVAITDMLLNIVEDENSDFAEANYPEDPDDGLARPYFRFFASRIRELLNMRENLQKMRVGIRRYRMRMAAILKRKDERDARQLGRSRSKTRKVKRSKTRKVKKSKTRKVKSKKIKKSKTRKNRRK